MNNEDSLLSISEAAKYLNVSTITLKRWGYAGKLKCIRHPINMDKLNGTV